MVPVVTRIGHSFNMTPTMSERKINEQTKVTLAFLATGEGWSEESERS
jgi:flagellar biosynthesis protein FliR